MRTNGTLSCKTTTSGGIDSDGLPVEVVTVWSDAIPCLIIPNTKGFLQKFEGGAFVPASYEIQIEAQPGGFTSETIRLTDNRGRDMGEHTILSENIRYMDAVQRIKILI
jgi:hypothetical protein